MYIYIYIYIYISVRSWYFSYQLVIWVACQATMLNVSLFYIIVKGKMGKKKRLKTSPSVLIVMDIFQRFYWNKITNQWASNSSPALTIKQLQASFSITGTGVHIKKLCRIKQWRVTVNTRLMSRDENHTCNKYRRFFSSLWTKPVTKEQRIFLSDWTCGERRTQRIQFLLDA